MSAEREIYAAVRSSRLSMSARLSKKTARTSRSSPGEPAVLHTRAEHGEHARRMSHQTPRNLDSPSVASSVSSASTVRCVSKLLRLRKYKHPVRVHSAMSVRDVVKMLREHRSDAAILVGNSGRVIGMLNASDIVSGIGAGGADPARVAAETIMSHAPPAASPSTLAAEAFNMMIEYETYHLPVVDSRGGVQGLLDAQLCLHDTLVKLESADEQSDITSEFGDSTVRRVNVGSIARDAISVCADATVRDAAMLMRKHCVSLVLVVKRAFSISDEGFDGNGDSKEDGRESANGIPRALLVGVVEANDITKIIDEQGKYAGSAPVCAVMKPPEIVRADCEALNALHVLNDSRRRHLVVESFGLSAEGAGGVCTTICGLVDMLDCAAAALGDAASPSPSPFHGEYDGAFIGGNQEYDLLHASPAMRRLFGDATASPSPAMRSSASTSTPATPATPTSRALSKWGANVPFKLFDEISGKTFRFTLEAEDLVILRISDDSLGKAGAHARDGIDDDCGGGNDDDDDRSLGLGVPTALLRMPSPSRPHRKSSGTTDVSISTRALWHSIDESVGYPLSEEAALFYVDDDGDEIHLETDADLLCAMNLAAEAGWSKVLLKTKMQGEATAGDGGAITAAKTAMQAQAGHLGFASACALGIAISIGIIVAATVRPRATNRS